MSRLHQRLFRLNERIARLAAEEQQAAAEVEGHRPLEDDARRDAAGSEAPIGRGEGRDTAAGGARFSGLVAELRRRRGRLEAKRDRLLTRLG